MKKKTLSLLLISILLIALSGCDSRNTTKKEKDNEESKTKIENIFKKDEEENKKDEEKVENKVDIEYQKTLLENELTEIGRYFYEDYYYKNIQKVETDPKAFVAEYEEIGIKVNIQNLANLPKYKEKIEKDFKNCDSKDTKVIIHPTVPYGPTDYEIKVNLSCSFDKDLSE